MREKDSPYNYLLRAVMEVVRVPLPVVVETRTLTLPFLLETTDARTLTLREAIEFPFLIKLEH